MTAAESYLAALASLPEAGPRRLRWLLSLGDPQEVWDRVGRGGLGAAALAQRRSLRIDDRLLQRWSEHAAKPWPRRMEEMLDRLDVRVTHGANMPARLSSDHDPPAVLFEQGRRIDDSAPVAAVVGTRRASPYGLRVAERMGRELSDAGVVVVSGLALGIDAAAHRGAIQGATPPVAVIGAAHDRPCPTRNRDLARAVSEGGTVLSEVPPGAPSAPWRYPARNRCIAAMGHVLVVVESPPSGGSMLTVTEAVGRDRVVMAVPGSIERPTSAGCHLLLRDGAHVCAGSVDVRCMLTLLGVHESGQTSPDRGDLRGDGPEPGTRERREGLVDLATVVLDLVEQTARTTDGLIDATGASVAEIGAALAQLEDRDLVRRRAGWIEEGGGGG
jgi:DNA processing protein